MLRVLCLECTLSLKLYDARLGLSLYAESLLWLQLASLTPGEMPEAEDYDL